MDDVYISKNQFNDNFFQPPQKDNPEIPPDGGKKKKKKKKGIGRRLLSLLLIIAFLIGVMWVIVFAAVSRTDYNEDGHQSNVYVDSDDLSSSSFVTNILLLGVDRRVASESSRSDTMLLLSIDRTHKKIKLTSFLRDSWVDIPGKGYAKLNAACSAGGAQMVMDTLEYNFDVKIDNYMLVDFDMFTEIIDGLGGIDIQVSTAEAKYMTKSISKVFGNDIMDDAENEEMSHFNGEQALWYCRIRKLDSDFKRTERQRRVLSTIFNKAKLTNPFKLISIINNIMPNIETDIDPLHFSFIIMGFALYVWYDIEQLSVPSDGTWSNATRNGQDVLLVDIDDNVRLLEEFLY